MASHTILPNGIGATLGDSLVTNSEFYLLGGSVWYVNSDIGTDAAAPAGKERQQPLATLGQAITNAAAGDVIVLQDGHAETYTATQTIGKAGLKIVGAGQSAGKPTVKFTNNQAAGGLFSVTVGGVQLRNIWFEENLQANSVERITVANLGFVMKGCYIEADENDDASVVLLNAGSDQCRFEGTTWISTATDITDPPETGLEMGNTTTDLSISGCVISGGTAGWVDGYAIRTNSQNQTRLVIEDLSMLLGADVEIADTSTALVTVGTSTGGARLEIFDPAA